MDHTVKLTQDTVTYEVTACSNDIPASNLLRVQALVWRREPISVCILPGEDAEAAVERSIRRRTGIGPEVTVVVDFDGIPCLYEVGGPFVLAEVRRCRRG